MSSTLTQVVHGMAARARARPGVHKSELLGVQRLRGLAVLMVVLVHIEDAARHLPGLAGFESWFARHLGYSAVDLFFVISGFIMAYITFTRPFEPRGWLISRVIRIYPMYLLFTGMAAALWVMNPAMTMGSGEQNWGRVLLSLAGWPQAELPLLFVGWTIEHEIVFYSVVFATACLLGRERLLPVMLVLSALALLRQAVQAGTGTVIWDLHLASPYILQFTLGVLVFHFGERLPALGWKLPAALGLLLLGLGSVFAEAGPINDEPMSRIVLFGLAWSAILVAVLNHERGLRAAGRMPTTRDGLVQLGDASYSLYLSHLFVLGASGKVFAHLGEDALTRLLAVAVAAGLTFAVGILTHLLVERQVIELGRVLSRPRSSSGAPT